MKKIALLFAGQGAQVVGMGKDLAEQFPTAADLFRRGDEILGRKLSDIAWNGPIEKWRKRQQLEQVLVVKRDMCVCVCKLVRYICIVVLARPLDVEMRRE